MSAPIGLIRAAVAAYGPEQKSDISDERKTRTRFVRQWLSDLGHGQFTPAELLVDVEAEFVRVGQRGNPNDPPSPNPARVR